MSDTTAEPLCDRISRIAVQLEDFAGDLRGLPGVSRLHAMLPEAVANLRNIADRVLEKGIELDELRTTNEGLRQMAIEAREAANGWHQATIDLYSGREETAPKPAPASAEAPQCASHAHPDFVEDPTIRCELPEGHVWHRNGERTWTP